MSAVSTNVHRIVRVEVGATEHLGRCDSWCRGITLYNDAGEVFEVRMFAESYEALVIEHTVEV